jgi:hypothetical protein
MARPITVDLDPTGIKTGGDGILQPVVIAYVLVVLAPLSTQQSLRPWRLAAARLLSTPLLLLLGPVPSSLSPPSPRW